jgi:hypothetical protein
MNHTENLDLGLPDESLPQRVRLGNPSSLRIVFRSDTRGPSTLFKQGMQSRDFSSPTKSPSPRFTGDDIVSETAVCVAATLAGAVVFPNKGQHAMNPDIWVYVMAIGDRQDHPDWKITHTYQMQMWGHMNQANPGMNMHWDNDNARVVPAVPPQPGYTPNPQQQGRPMAFWALYAHELAVKQIPPFDLIAALKVKRTFNGDREAQDFVIERVELNPTCLVPSLWRQTALDIVLNSYHLNHTYPAAQLTGGFTDGEGRTLTKEEFIQRMF